MRRCMQAAASRGPHVLHALVVVALTLATASATTTDCKSLLEILPTTCSDVPKMCDASSCDNVTGTFSCSSPVQCTGVLYTALPFSSSLPRCPSTLNLTAFEGCRTATDELAAIGCTCSSCLFQGDEVEIHCSSPFQCSEIMMVQPLVYTDKVALVTDKVEYGVIWGVYLGAALLLVVVVEVYKKCIIPPCPITENLPKVRGGWLRDKWLQGVLMMVARFVEDDGSLPKFCRLCTHFPLKTSSFLQLFLVASVRFPPHHRRVIFLGRTLVGFVSTLAIPASFVILLGTVDFNNEKCSNYARVFTKCHDGTMGYAGNGSAACLFGSVKYDKIAKVTIAVLGGVFNIAAGRALNVATYGCRYQILPIAARAVVTLALFIFAYCYSNTLADAEGAEPLDTESFLWHSVVAWLLGLVGHCGMFSACLVIFMTMPEDFLPYFRVAAQQDNWCPCDLNCPKNRVSPSATIDAPPVALDAVILQTEPGGAK